MGDLVSDLKEHLRTYDELVIRVQALETQNYNLRSRLSTIENLSKDLFPSTAVVSRMERIHTYSKMHI